MLPDHPEIARTLRTGYPYPLKTLFCADCGCELTGDIFISDGDVICADCLKERLLESYSIDDLADAFDIQKTTASDYLEESEENPYDGE